MNEPSEERDHFDPVRAVEGAGMSSASLRGMAYKDHHFEDVDEDFEILPAPTTAAVQTAWDYYLSQTNRHGRFLKSRLSLRAMAPFAHYLWMAEYHPDDDYFSIRLWSTGSTEVLGADMTGAIIEEKGAVAKWTRLYRQIIRTGEPVILRNKMSESEKSFLTTEVAALPLYDEFNGILYILCPYMLI